MPHFGLHMHLATTVLDGWREEGRRPPFDLRDPAARNAFLHGAMGPDMGYFPGGEHLLSQAAHVVRSGDLIRRLVATAQTDAQRAFAYGWLTHMLGDVLVHPVINAAAEELLDRERTPRTRDWHQNAHIRVELGLDAIYVARHRAVRAIRLRPFFDGSTARWMTDAFHHVHGVAFRSVRVMRSHHQVVRLHRPLLFLERLIAVGRGPAHPMRRAMGRLFMVSRGLAERRLGPHSSVTGFLNTVRPEATLVREVDGIARGFGASYAAFVRLQLETRTNYSLDTGELERPGQPSPEGLRARAKLDAVRSGQATRAGDAVAVSA